MIVIKVELWPLGDESAKREIASGKIWNDGTGDHSTGNYDAEFTELHPEGSLNWVSHVEEFPRVNGVLDLLYEALEMTKLKGLSYL
jgi:hypothetical protein